MISSRGWLAVLLYIHHLQCCGQRSGSGLLFLRKDTIFSHPEIGAAVRIHISIYKRNFFLIEWGKVLVGTGLYLVFYDIGTLNTNFVAFPLKIPYNAYLAAVLQESFLIFYSQSVLIICSKPSPPP
jgi:hypothetical protein